MIKETQNTITEYCPYCETEVELYAELRKQVCPNCKEYIKPCSICEDNNCIACHIK